MGYVAYEKNEVNQTLMDIAITNKANPEAMMMLLALACQFAPNTIEPFLIRLSPEQAAAAILATTGTKNWGGWNALMFACRYAPDAVEAMLNKLSPEQARDAIFHDTGDFSDDEDGALSIAEKYAKDAFVLLVHKLLTLKNNVNQTLIDAAVEKGNSTMIKNLISLGTCVNNFAVVLKGQKVETVNYLYKHNYILRPPELILNAKEMPVQHMQPEVISLIGSGDRFFSSKESRSFTEISGGLGDGRGLDELSDSSQNGNA